jgi:hypothetical protein
MDASRKEKAVALEVIIAVVALGLFAITYGMFWSGLAGAGRLLWLKRCPHCGHLRATTDEAKYRTSECSYCRHPWLTARLTHSPLRHNFHREW